MDEIFAGRGLRHAKPLLKDLDSSDDGGCNLDKVGK